MTCFKVVEVIDDQRFSYATPHKPYRLTYGVGVKTVAPIGGCLAFSTIKSANSLFRASLRITIGGPFEVWLANGTNPVPLRGFSYSFGTTEEEAWKEEKRSPWWPEDTVAYREIELIRLIKRSNP